MKKSLQSIFAILFIITCVVLPYVALAVDTVVKPDAQPEKPKGNIIVCEKGVPDCTWKDLIKTIDNFIEFAFVIAVALATISFAYAGWLYLSAGDDTGQTSKARCIFWKVIKGFVIMAVAWLLVKALLSIADPDFSGLK